MGNRAGFEALQQDLVTVLVHGEATTSELWMYERVLLMPDAMLVSLWYSDGPYDGEENNLVGNRAGFETLQSAVNNVLAHGEAEYYFAEYQGLRLIAQDILDTQTAEPITKGDFLILNLLSKQLQICLEGSQSLHIGDQ